MLAACRNLGVGGAELDDVVVVNDADTLPSRRPCARRSLPPRTSGRVHLPYTEYRWLGAEGTAQLRAGARPPRTARSTSCAAPAPGVYVTTPRTWAAHGGQDERFRGWGFEDAAWYLAHETLLGRAAGPPRRPRVRDAPLAEVRAGTGTTPMPR